MYVQEYVPEWVEKYKPNAFAYTVENYHARTGEILPDVIRGCGLHFGSLTVSIQWSDYNYCDHYVGKSIFGQYRNPIYKGQFCLVYEAEVALICRSRFDFYKWGTTYHFVKFDEYENVKAYATVTEIEDIISVCAGYAQS